METDYEKIGLKCGLELHQQLDTGKLFIRTPSRLREDAPDYTIERKLRPVVSELGEFDKAALEAFKKGHTFIYEGYNDTISLIELDDEPPQPADREALNTTLEISLMAGAEILDEIVTMRKLVIDGSNTSGFQRTMLVSIGGKVKLANKELGIQTIVLEEDSARPVEKTGERVVYRLDRLGVPLIELATQPGITRPEEAKEAARAIGTIFRLTGKVKRGLGTIRQDLNVSIREGARVEIKGVQELEIIDEYVRREVHRQIALVEIKKELEHRGLSKKELEQNPVDVSKIFAKTQAKIIESAIQGGGIVLAVKLPKFAGLLGKEVQQGRRLGTEIAGYVKARTGLRGIFHSDELPKYGVSEQEVLETKKILGAKQQDAFALVAAPKPKAQRAMETITERAQSCLDGVPEETRGAIEEGNTEYLRPLPGSARMYPETDLESIIVDEKTIAHIKKNLPLGTKEREALYKKLGLNEKHANEMKTSNFARMFEEKCAKGADAKKMAVFLLETLVEARRKGAQIDLLSSEELEEILDAIVAGKIPKEVQVEFLVKKTKNPQKSVSELVTELGESKVESAQAHEIIKTIVAKNSKLVKELGERAVGPLMGDAMKELKGKASGKEISELLLQEIKKQSGN
ncbi:MAG: Glu-tRNA(Gln) amidotransferase subunit GatE [archaeon]|nr:Glu-tRNA(Gln) amidotransferase subunit GatE [archaeon]